MRSSIPGFLTTASLTMRVSTAPASLASATPAGPDAQLREDLVKVGGTGVSRREHLAMARRPDGRQFPDAILAELREERFFVVQGKEGDQGLLGRRNGLLDPSQLMWLPRLDDREDVINGAVQCVIPPQVLRSLDDDTGDA